jgi:hypothetical protein
VAEKPDAAEIAEFVRELPSALRLGERRAWWTQRIFRFDDIRNVASILRRGALLSRERCDDRGILYHDAANRAIIDQTEYAHSYVRLYFRPLTPTQYRMEGIKARSELTATGEHCPVPVFLLFDAARLLSTEGVMFTDGSVARRGQFNIGDNVEFLRTIPFETVYHDGTIYGDANERSEVIFRRHAEVLIKDELSLDHLHRVICRTGPERDTLLHLLGDDAGRFEDKIRIAPPGIAMFYRRGMFVEGYRLIDGQLYFQMPSRALVYDADLRVFDPETGAEIARRVRSDAKISGKWHIAFDGTPKRVRVEFKIEGALAFAGIVSQQEVLG